MPSNSVSVFWSNVITVSLGLELCYSRVAGLFITELGRDQNAQIEKELLTVLIALENLNVFTLDGRWTMGFSHHPPLQTIMSKPLHMAHRRPQFLFLQLKENDVELRY